MLAPIGRLGKEFPLITPNTMRIRWCIYLDINYYRKINNTFQSSSKNETELYLINRNEDRWMYDNIDAQDVIKNGVHCKIVIIKDTDGNPHKKKIKSKKSETFSLGDYIEWNNSIWLVTAIDPDNKVHNSGYMYLCTILLRWQNSSGKIVERHAYAEDFTKYSTGQSGVNTVYSGDYQYGLTVPVDEETKILKRGVRFAIDFEDNYPPDVYELTNRKTYLTDDRYFSRGAIMVWTLSYNYFSENLDKLVELENGTKAWICDYDSTLADSSNSSDSGDSSADTNNTDNSDSGDSTGTEVITTTISGNKYLKVSMPRTYTVKFINEENESVELDDFEWQIKSDYEIASDTNGSKIQLNIDDPLAIGSTITLCVVRSNNVIAQYSITVIDNS